jgi:hypothetical protein
MKKEAPLQTALRNFMDMADKYRQLQEDYTKASRARHYATQTTLLPAVRQTLADLNTSHTALHEAIKAAHSHEFTTRQANNLHTTWNAVRGAKDLYAKEGGAQNLFHLRDQEAAFYALLKTTRQVINTQQQ